MMAKCYDEDKLDHDRRLWVNLFEKKTCRFKIIENETTDGKIVHVLNDCLHNGNRFQMISDMGEILAVKILEGCLK